MRTAEGGKRWAPAAVEDTRAAPLLRNSWPLITEAGAVGSLDCHCHKYSCAAMCRGQGPKSGGGHLKDLARHLEKAESKVHIYLMIDSTLSSGIVQTILEQISEFWHVTYLSTLLRQWCLVQLELKAVVEEVRILFPQVKVSIPHCKNTTLKSCIENVTGVKACKYLQHHTSNQK